MEILESTVKLAIVATPIVILFSGYAIARGVDKLITATKETRDAVVNDLVLDMDSIKRSLALIEDNLNQD